MKKTIFIILGVVLLILVVGVWAYLFAFGTPKSGEDIFARFGAGNDAETTNLPEKTNIDVQDTTPSGGPQMLKQLTTRPVAGASFASGSMRYVEQGTGHVYDINLSTGTETLLSGTTLPGARDAVFSPDGSYVAITMLAEGKEMTLVGMLSFGTPFSGVSLQDNAENIAFVNASGTLEYTITDSQGTKGYSYSFAKNTNAEVFSLPLKDIEVLWGNPTYVYTTPTAAQTGYLYKVIKNDLHYVTEGDRGLMGFVTHNGVVVTRVTDAGVKSFLITTDGRRVTQPLSYISEKCASGETFLYCAIPKDTLNTQTFPDNWYMGVVSFEDSLWTVDTENQKAAVLVDFMNESGRAMDVLKIGADREGKRVYLINKNDNTLWLFDTTLAKTGGGGM